MCCSFDTTQNRNEEYYSKDGSGNFVTTITKVFKKFANEYENRPGDHGYSQKQVREKWSNTTIKSCYIREKETVVNNFHLYHDHITVNILGFTHAE